MGKVPTSFLVVRARKFGCLLQGHSGAKRYRGHSLGRQTSGTSPIPEPITLDATTNRPQSALVLSPVNADQLAADMARLPVKDAATMVEGLSDSLALDVLQRAN